MTGPATCWHDRVLYYRDRCPHPEEHEPAAPAPLPAPHVPAQLAADRALAIRAIMPRAYAERGTTPPAVMYARLTNSARAEVDRVVDAFGVVRRNALARRTIDP